MTTKKIALITGASSGIGQATARIFAKNGIDVVICGRRSEKLAQLALELGTSVRASLVFDVTNQKEVFEQINSLDFPIDILLNNAGNAHGLANFQNGELEDFDAMIDTNVKGLIYVSKAVLPKMIPQKNGHIINIGSIAGKEVYPNGNVYCASKYAVDALSHALRMDLLAENIKVGAINPGMVDTEFSLVRFKGDAQKAQNVYANMNPLTAVDIAEIIYFMVSRPAHVNIADLLVLPTQQASATQVRRDNVDK